MKLGDYLANDGLGYSTLWSIGCPFHCSFCGNTKFIANDPAYKKIRHPSARYMVDEIKNLRRKFPHVSQVSFHDDSFMAITYRELETFAELWQAELGIPFAVYGVIPNYVKQDKFEILTWAGMNRVRMGIQSGSQAILDFYKRPTPPERIEEAAEVIGSFAPKYHIPPAYDIIMDNPIETRQDVVDTLELLYRMPRPYTLAHLLAEGDPQHRAREGDEGAGRRHRGDLGQLQPDSQQGRQPPALRPRAVAAAPLALQPPPGSREASSTPQREYPLLGMVLRTLYVVEARRRPPPLHGLLDHPGLVRLRRLEGRADQALAPPLQRAPPRPPKKDRGERLPIPVTLLAPESTPAGGTAPVVDPIAEANQAKRSSTRSSASAHLMGRLRLVGDVVVWLFAMNAGGVS